MPTSARTNLSGDNCSGTNNGSITPAMNSTVINGTPRTNSMKITDNDRTAGMCDRRPSARRIPSGNETTIPTEATTIVTSTPPHSTVSTGRNPIHDQPLSKMNDETGNIAKK